MDFFRYCDLFNVNFHFSHENKIGISIFGGLMSICFLVGCIFAILILSMDDFNKINPITTKSEVPGGEFRVINLSESKIWIPWRLITYEEKFIDHRGGILYPMIYLIEGELNDEIGMDLKYHNLQYKLCNETSMVNITNLYKIDTPLNELFCIEQDNIPFGGSWLGDNLYYLEINLFLCEGGIEFNSTDERCTPLHDLVKFTNTTWLFEFYYPVVQFQPTNHEIPLMVIYKNYYYRLSSHTYKVERLYVQENILSDDKSLFSTSYSNTSCWGISTIYGDTYYWTEEHDPLVKSNSSCLFSLDIYMDQGHIYYTRSFKKIFEIISNVFPVLNILLIFFRNLTILIKRVFAKKSIIELLFEKSRIIKYKNKILYPHENNNHNNNNHINKNYKTNNEKKSSFFNSLEANKKSKVEESIKISKESSEMIYKFSNYNDIIKQLKNKNNTQNNRTYNTANMKKSSPNLGKFINNKNDSYIELYNNSLNIVKVNNNSIKSKEKSINSSHNDSEYKIYNFLRSEKMKLFPVFYYFMDIFIDKLSKPKRFCCLDKRYLIVYNFMGRILDISSYILMNKYFNIYKNVIQRDMKNLNIPDITKKININDNEMMENIKQKIFRNDYENYEIFSKTLIS